MEIDAEALLDMARRERERTGAHVTMTHLVGKAVAEGLAAVPTLAMRLAHGREYPRESIDVFFIVATEGGDELTGVKVTGVDRLSPAEIATELERRTSAIATGSDQEFGRAKQMLTVLPPWVLRRALRISAWLSSDLHLDLPVLGVRREAFGGAMVTSVGMWGVPHAYSPLAGYYRVPLLVCIGAVRQRPVAVAGQVVVRPVFTLTATFDHRYVDGFHAAHLARAVEESRAHPCCQPHRPPVSTPNMRILVVEDAKRLASSLRTGLEAEGFAVDTAYDGTEGLWYAREHAYDAILLDIMLPGLNGYKVCETLRAEQNWTPILMLTAKDGDLDQVEALDTGADDYVTKPFSFQVLLARVRSLLRRGRPERPALLTVGDLVLDPASHAVTRAGTELSLTSRELSLLEFLMRRAGEVVTKADILGHVWDYAFEGDPNIIEVYVGRLRRKVDRPFGRADIETLRGSGYRLRVPDPADQP
jgi:DNA-binding response OmpR family regulator